MRYLTFPPFAFDRHHPRLYRGRDVIPLRPKTVAVLQYLLSHPGRWITADELCTQVWAGYTVSAGVPRVCIRELRAALGDEAKTPCFITTAHRFGYRFIADLHPSDSLPAQEPSPHTPHAGVSPSPLLPVSSFCVGRVEEFQQLQKALDAAQQGRRQVMFVTGEPGIGKTTLLKVFTQHLANDTAVRIAWGQCLDQHGVGEPYLPVLDALEHLTGGPEHEQMIALLRQYAPTWLTAFPSLLAPGEHTRLEQQTSGATPERRLRELARTLEALTRERLLILVLEDLHWSDPSTLDLLAYLARCEEPARLLILGAYRPVEILLREHPLKGVKRDLQQRGACTELPLSLLSAAAVEEYLRLRLEDNGELGEVYHDESSLIHGTKHGSRNGGRLPSRHSPEKGDARLDKPAVAPDRAAPSFTSLHDFAQLIHRRTEGNPLFMVDVVNDWLAHAPRLSLTAQGDDITKALARQIPSSLRERIVQQLNHLNEAWRSPQTALLT